VVANQIDMKQLKKLSKESGNIWSYKMYFFNEAFKKHNVKQILLLNFINNDDLKNLNEFYEVLLNIQLK
jgi:hypothetical protein